jgi:hypothetical protein
MRVHPNHAKAQSASAPTAKETIQTLEMSVLGGRATAVGGCRVRTGSGCTGCGCALGRAFAESGEGASGNWDQSRASPELGWCGARAPRPTGATPPPSARADKTTTNSGRPTRATAFSPFPHEPQLAKIYRMLTRGKPGISAAGDRGRRLSKVGGDSTSLSADFRSRGGRETFKTGQVV